MWYLWCPGCGSELRFLYCEDVRLCCAHEMLEFFHGAPYAVCLELKIFICLCFVLEVLFVSCVGVWGCEELGGRCMEVCVMGICGESRDVQGVSVGAGGDEVGVLGVG